MNINDIQMCSVISETPEEYFNAEYKSLVGYWDGSGSRRFNSGFLVITFPRMEPEGN